MQLNVNKQRLKVIDNHLALYSQSLKSVNENYKTGLKVLLSSLEEKREIDRFYFCPFCLTSFICIIFDSLQGSGEFDLDHYPPKSVKGRNTILVCKECNSNFGKEFDHSVKQYLIGMAFLSKKNISINSKFSLSNVKGKYGTDLLWENDVLVTNIDFKKYPPLQKGLLEAGKTGLNNFSVKLSFSLPHEDLIHKAFLKAAYLGCFSYWGYDFAISHVGRNIIKVLNNGIKHPLSNMGVFKDESLSSLNEGLYYAEFSNELKCFLYAFNSSLRISGQSAKTFVLIPPFKKSSWEELGKFQKIIPRGEQTITFAKVKGIGVLDSEYLGYTESSMLLFD